MYNLIKEIFKIIFNIVAPIFVTLFIIFIFMYILHVIKIIFKITAFAIYEPSIQLTLIIFILLSIFLLIKWYKKINWRMIFLYCFLFFFIAFIINIFIIEKRITDIAINQYGVEPSYLDINFDVDAEFKEPHAVIYKNKKSYYWSFEKNNFILNTNPRLHL